MKTETIAVTVYQQPLRIAQLSNASTKPLLQIIQKEAAANSATPGLQVAANPANWDETWFANYE